MDMDYENFYVFENFSNQLPVFNTSSYLTATLAPPPPTSTQPYDRGFNIPIHTRCETNNHYLNEDTNNIKKIINLFLYFQLSFCDI